MNRWNAKLAGLLTGFFMLLAPLQGHALDSDRQQPIRIEADRVEIDERQGTSTYSGSVQVRQGTLRLDAERVVVHRGEETVQHIVAYGRPAKFQQRPEGADYLIRGQARELRYKSGTATVELSGEAHLWQGRDEFSGARVVYELDRERVQAEGGTDEGRVRAIIHPRQEEGEN